MNKLRLLLLSDDAHCVISMGAGPRLHRRLFHVHGICGRRPGEFRAGSRCGAFGFHYAACGRHLRDPPDGTGDINNFTLIYVSNNLELVLVFNLAGVPALYDPSLTYQFTYDSTGKSGFLYVTAEAWDCLRTFWRGSRPTLPRLTAISRPIGGTRFLRKS